MSASIPLSYCSLKCIVSHLDYNIRLQLAVQCPSFITAQKATPAKIKNLSITRLGMEIDKTEYRLKLVRHAGVLYTQLLTTSHNSIKIERGVYDVRWKLGIDYLIQRLIESRPKGGPPDAWNLDDKITSLAPQRLRVKSLEFGNDLYTYPILNTAEKLTITEEIDGDSLNLITRPKVYFDLRIGSNYRYARNLIDVCCQELTRRAHYSIVVRRASASWAPTFQFRHDFGSPTKRMPGGQKCYSFDCLSAEELEVNVYTTERQASFYSEYSIEIVISPRGTALPI